MKTKNEQKKEEKKKIKDLQQKEYETRIQTKELNIISKREEQHPNRKAEIRLIKKLNRTPKGKPNVKNKPGNIIDVTDIEKTYVTGNTTYKALKRVSFSIKRGEIVVILGRSGSGKSTLLNLISGLDRATSGDIVINNINISALRSSELTTFRRNNVGFVFQSYNLLPSLNARDNAEIAASLQTDGNKRIPVEEIFEKIGMKEFMNNNIKNLSGGQQQRVSIARALAKNPEIIFADEPTGALDVETSKVIIQLLIDINKKYNTTIVLVTHDNTLVNIADKTLYVQDGKIKEA